MSDKIIQPFDQKMGAWRERLGELIGREDNENYVTMTDSDKGVVVNITSSNFLNRMADRVRARFSSSEQKKNRETIDSFYKVLTATLNKALAANKDHAVLMKRLIGKKDGLVSEATLRKETEGILGNRGEKGRPLSGRRAACIADQAIRYVKLLSDSSKHITFASKRPLSLADWSELRKKHGGDFYWGDNVGSNKPLEDISLKKLENRLEAERRVGIICNVNDLMEGIPFPGRKELEEKVTNMEKRVEKERRLKANKREKVPTEEVKTKPDENVISGQIFLKFMNEEARNEFTKDLYKKIGELQLGHKNHKDFPLEMRITTRQVEKMLGIAHSHVFNIKREVQNMGQVGIELKDIRSEMLNETVKLIDESIEETRKDITDWLDELQTNMGRELEQDEEGGFLKGGKTLFDLHQSGTKAADTLFGMKKFQPNSEQFMEMLKKKMTKTPFDPGLSNYEDKDYKYREQRLTRLNGVLLHQVCNAFVENKAEDWLKELVGESVNNLKAQNTFNTQENTQNKGKEGYVKKEIYAIDEATISKKLNREDFVQAMRDHVDPVLLFIKSPLFDKNLELKNLAKLSPKNLSEIKKAMSEEIEVFYQAKIQPWVDWQVSILVGMHKKDNVTNEYYHQVYNPKPIPEEQEKGDLKKEKLEKNNFLIDSDSDDESSLDLDSDFEPLEKDFSDSDFEPLVKDFSDDDLLSPLFEVIEKKK